MSDNAELAKRLSEYQPCLQPKMAIVDRGALDEAIAELSKPASTPYEPRNYRQKYVLQMLLGLACQYRDDLMRPPTGDSLERRLKFANEAIAMAEQA